MSQRAPLLVQLIFWYNIAALYPVIAFGLPFGGPSLVLGSANVLITPLGAALLGLSLNEAAYMAEIIRGGIGSVDKGQYDAARALGMNGGKLMRRVILPQAMRVVLPPTGNQVISMLKGTSLVSVLAISDLLYSAQIIYANNYQTIPLLIVASLWYLLMTTILSFFQNQTRTTLRPRLRRRAAADPPSERPSQRQGQHDERRHGGSPGSPQELRLNGNPQGHRSEGRTRIGDLPDRAVRFRERRPSSGASTTWKRSTPDAFTWTNTWSATPSATDGSTK